MRAFARARFTAAFVAFDPIRHLADRECEPTVSTFFYLTLVMVLALLLRELEPRPPRDSGWAPPRDAS